MLTGWLKFQSIIYDEEEVWHDAAGPDPSQVPIFIIFELYMK